VKLNELSLWLSDGEVTALAPFEGVRVQPQQMGESGPSLLLLGLRPGGEAQLIAFLIDQTAAQVIPQGVVPALYSNNPLVDLRRHTRPPSGRERAALDKGGPGESVPGDRPGGGGDADPVSPTGQHGPQTPEAPAEPEEMTLPDWGEPPHA
jgi:hypothetical protein